MKQELITAKKHEVVEIKRKKERGEWREIQEKMRKVVRPGGGQYGEM